MQDGHGLDYQLCAGLERFVRMLLPSAVYCLQPEIAVKCCVLRTWCQCPHGRLRPAQQSAASVCYVAEADPIVLLLMTPS